jgi:hypothetical protein
MQIRQIQGIFIDFFNDDIMNISYGRILTLDTLEVIKLPTILENYKYRYLLQPSFLVNIEVVKTRKNWILKSVLDSQEIYKPQDYQDFVNLAEVIKLLQKNIIEEQKTQALEFILSYFAMLKSTQSKIDILNFDKMLQKVMGY